MGNINKINIIRGRRISLDVIYFLLPILYALNNL